MKATGNTIFVTGGTSGIGRGLAEAFHALGNKVIVGGRRKTLLDEVTRANPGIESVELDIADPASIDRVAKTLLKRFPELNVLVNNAGIMPFDDPAKPVDEATMQAVVTTNLYGPIRMTSALIEHLKRRPDAVIVNNTSVLAFVPIATNAVYSATKAALHSFTLSQRFQLRETTVKVQEIAPPWVSTDLVFKSSDSRAMPLDIFVQRTVAGLVEGHDEVVVTEILPFRDNPGSKEHAVVNAFNDSLRQNPIPTH